MRIQRKRKKGWRMPENAVYVGRPSIYENPFKVGMFSNTLGDVLEAYDQLLKTTVADNPDFLKPLIGKDLACWCSLDKPCHADILEKMRDKMFPGVD